MYVWFELCTLPFRFIFSELFMWNREQLYLISQCHRVIMSFVLASSAVLLGLSTFSVIGQDGDDYSLRQVRRQVSRVEEKQQKTEDQVTDLKIQMATLTVSVNTLTKELSFALNMVLGCLGAIGVAMLGILGNAVYRMKMRFAMQELQDRERAGQ